MSIKARLTAAVVVLVAAATGILGWIVVDRTRASLVEQVDDQLRVQAERPPARGLPPGFDDERDANDEYQPTAELLLTSDGEVIPGRAAGFPDDPEPYPDLSGLSADGLAELRDGEPVTVPAESGGSDYRIIASPGPEGTTLVLAASLQSVDATTSDLLRTVVITGVAVVLIGGVVSWWLIRRGLRPIDRMIDTAGEIAAGDLTHRVDHRDDGTELGRLASALDDMLTRLEAAFAEREESEARLRQFVADASHELRTPVAAVRGYAELYRQGGLTEQQALDRAMGRIEGESARMGALVEDLLLLARLEREQPLTLVDVDLTALARDALADLRAVDPGRPATLDATGPVVVRGDDARLRQVLANLLTNVRVHTPAGTPVHVTVGADAHGAHLVVADEGPGIPPDERELVFERFYRADPSRVRHQDGGTGLGLAIVAAVAAAHHGHVEVDERPGGGARVTVTLPTDVRGQVAR